MKLYTGAVSNTSMLRYTLLSCCIRLRQGSAFKEVRYENTMLHPSAIKMRYRIRKEGLTRIITRKSVK